MARRQQLLNKTSDMSDNELKKNDNLLLNKEDRRVTFANETQKILLNQIAPRLLKTKYRNNTTKN